MKKTSMLVVLVSLVLFASSVHAADNPLLREPSRCPKGTTLGVMRFAFGTILTAQQKQEVRTGCVGTSTVSPAVQAYADNGHLMASAENALSAAQAGIDVSIPVAVPHSVATTSATSSVVQDSDMVALMDQIAKIQALIAQTKQVVVNKKK